MRLSICVVSPTHAAVPQSGTPRAEACLFPAGAGSPEVNCVYHSENAENQYLQARRRSPVNEKGGRGTACTLNVFSRRGEREHASPFSLLAGSQLGGARGWRAGPEKQVVPSAAAVQVTTARDKRGGNGQTAATSSVLVSACGFLPPLLLLLETACGAGRGRGVCKAQAPAGTATGAHDRAASTSSCCVDRVVVVSSHLYRYAGGAGAARRMLHAAPAWRASS